MTEQKPLEPWQWPEAHWRKLVNQVRAGRALRPKTWKDGARCAVALSFDSDHETNELRDGGKSIGRMSWGQYGNRVAIPRILSLLRKYEVMASFYVPAVVALLYPDEGAGITNDRLGAVLDRSTYLTARTASRSCPRARCTAARSEGRARTKLARQATPHDTAAVCHVKEPTIVVPAV